MRAYTLSFPRAGLFALHQQIAAALAQMPEASPERLVALVTRRNIRRVLARWNVAPR